MANVKNAGYALIEKAIPLELTEEAVDVISKGLKEKRKFTEKFTEFVIPAVATKIRDYFMNVSQ